MNDITRLEVNHKFRQTEVGRRSIYVIQNFRRLVLTITLDGNSFPVGFTDYPFGHSFLTCYEGYRHLMGALGYPLIVLLQ